MSGNNENTDLDEKLAEAKSLLRSKFIVKALTILEECCSKCEQTYGEMTRECVPSYYLMALALLDYYYSSEAPADDVPGTSSTSHDIKSETESELCSNMFLVNGDIGSISNKPSTADNSSIHPGSTDEENSDIEKLISNLETEIEARVLNESSFEGSRKRKSTVDESVIEESEKLLAEIDSVMESKDDNQKRSKIQKSNGLNRSSGHACADVVSFGTNDSPANDEYFEDNCVQFEDDDCSENEENSEAELVSSLEESKLYFRKVCEIVEQLTTPENASKSPLPELKCLANSYLRLAEIHLENNEPAEAQKHAENCLKHALKTEPCDHRFVSEAYFTGANLAHRLSENEKAMKMFAECKNYLNCRIDLLSKSEPISEKEKAEIEEINEVLRDVSKAITTDEA